MRLDFSKKTLLCSILFTSTFLSCNGQNKPSGSDNIAEKKVLVKVVGPSSDISADYLMGKFDPSKHPDFVEIPKEYADRPGQFIRLEVLGAFIKMYNAAMLEGVRLQIRSATRNFNDQKRIWENKWTGKTILEDNINAAKDISDDLTRSKKILEYSSMPGTSRHHWGTDMDFNSFSNEWFEKGEGYKLYSWMLYNAAKYGFCQPYTKMGSDRTSGYFEEKWHWTYMPLSKKYTQSAKTIIKNEMISGFLGSETAIIVDMLNNYILGISPSCLQSQN